MQTTVDHPRYWLVWREGGNAPTYRHPDQASAEAEAKRLAHAFRGETFAVLCPYARVTVSNLIIERLSGLDDGIPF